MAGEAKELTVHNLGLVVDPQNFLSLLAAHLQAAADGHNCLHLKTVGPAALHGCLTAASGNIALLPC